MTRCRPFLLSGLVVLALASACAQSTPKDARVIVVPSSTALKVSDPNISRSGDGFLRVVVQLSNPSGQSVNGVYMVQWLDKLARPIPTLLSDNRPITVPSQNWVYIDVISPTPDAEDFRIRIEDRG